MAGNFVAMLTPLLLHMGISEMAAFLLWQAVCFFGGGPETAAAVTGGYAALLGNLLVLPFAVWMYRRDMNRDTEECGGRGQPAQERCRRLSASGLSAGSAGLRRRKIGLRRREVWPETQENRSKTQKGWTETQGNQRIKRRASNVFLPALLCLAAGGILNVLYSGLLNALHIQDFFSSQVQEQLLSVPWPLQLAGLGLLVPVTEELIFRGLTYRRMRRVLPALPAIVLSALLFAVYHGNPLQIIFAFPMAVVLAALYERGKLFVFPVLFHVGANLTAVFLNFLL